jgi:hypothetical protein
MAKILCALYPDHALIVTSDKDGPGAIMDRDAVVRVILDCGQLAGYAGDVWYPATPAYFPWRTMPHNPASYSVSGTTSPGSSGRIPPSESGNPLVPPCSAPARVETG